MSKKQSNFILGLVVLIVSVFAILFSNDPAKDISFGDKLIKPSPNSYEKEVFQVSNLPSKSPIPTQVNLISENELKISPTNQQVYRVVKVVDGDTLDVDIDGKIERLRLIGIDTPETLDPRKSVQCFGLEASNKAKELLSGQLVSLEADPSQTERDKYKRLLRYVFLSDGTNFNKYMILEGYAHEYTYDEAYKYQLEFKQAEIEAKNNGKGLWSTQTCSGNK